jgi:hypothetical protein
MEETRFNLRELPTDLLSCVLERLAEYGCDDSERYQTLTLDSKQSIFSARLVGICQGCGTNAFRYLRL